MSIHVGVDLVIFAFQESALKILLVKRETKPNGVRLPGASLRENELLDDAARRGLKHFTGVTPGHVEQLYCFGNLGGNNHKFNVAYFALLRAERTRANGAAWRNVKSLAGMTASQRRIVNDAVRRLRKKVATNTAAFQLLSGKFTLSELQALYETVLNKKLDKRNFRKKMDVLGVLKPLSEWRRTGRKPARLYKVADKNLKKLESKIGLAL